MGRAAARLYVQKKDSGKFQLTKKNNKIDT